MRHHDGVTMHTIDVIRECGMSNKCYHFVRLPLANGTELIGIGVKNHSLSPVSQCAAPPNDQPARIDPECHVNGDRPFV